MSFYHQDDCDGWKWNKVSKSEPSKPCQETDILSSVYTNKPDKLGGGCDLIRRDYIVEVYNRVKEACKNCDNYNGVRCRACDIGDELLDLQDIIDNAPAVDISGNEYFPFRTAYFNGVADGRATARPHGSWIQAKDEDGIEIYRKNLCSCCNKASVEKYLFCPNCGADMQGVNNDKN